MLEWAEFAGNCYGTPRAAVEERLAAGVDVLLEIEVQGARQVRAAMGDGRRADLPGPAVLRGTGPPAGRPGHRGRADRQARLRAALAELAAEPEFDHTVVNTSVEDAVARVGRLDG